MDESNQHKAIEALRDWSKWLIGVNFAAATGCVVVLQAGVKGPPRPFLLLAIAAFALSVLCSAILVRVLASLVEKLPFKDINERGSSIYLYKPFKLLSLKLLSWLQLFLFMLGITFFLLWVVLKPPPKDTTLPQSFFLYHDITCHV